MEICSQQSSSSKTYHRSTRIARSSTPKCSCQSSERPSAKAGLHNGGVCRRGPQTTAVAEPDSTPPTVVDGPSVEHRHGCHSDHRACPVCKYSLSGKPSVRFAEERDVSNVHAAQRLLSEAGRAALAKALGVILKVFGVYVRRSLVKRATSV